MTVESILKELKTRVTEHRYNHTLGVIKEATELAEIYSLDVEKCRIAAALHDFSKGDDINQQKERLISEFGTETVNSLPIGGYHAYTGYLEAKKMGITDPDILNPIKYHTTGKAAMSKYEMLLFIADFTEEGREYPESKVAHKIARESLFKAVYYIEEEIYKMLKSKGFYIAPITYEVLNYYKEHQND